MDVREAYDLLSASIRDPGRHYAGVGDLSLGTGLILSGVGYPVYLEKEEEYAIAEGLVYVLSHECDVSQENDRPFIDSVVVVPIIPIDALLSQRLIDKSDEQLTSLFQAISEGDVERVIYMPPIGDSLPYGGIIYFGALTSTHISECVSPMVTRCAALTAYGLSRFDLAFERAFRKPKSERLALAPYN